MAQQIEKKFLEQTKNIQTIIGKLANPGIYTELYKEWKIEEIHKKVDNELNEIIKKHKNIDNKIKRKWGKLYFLGKMSSGKTKLINGIIGEDLFLSTTNCTTSCFVNIRKSEDKIYKIVYQNEEFIYQNKDEAKEKIEDLSTGGNGTKIDINEFIEIFIPIDNNNKIWTENVELIDTPGFGNTDKINECIQNYAIDSDIVIFVLNYDITEEEVKFFKFLIANSLKPNIFILINKWDQTDDDEEIIVKNTRESLFGKSYLFISNIFGPETKNINKKVYFVSSKEIFDIRLKKINIPDFFDAKQKARYDDFLKFENEILKYIKNLENNKILQYKSEIEILRKDLNKLLTELSEKISGIDMESPLKIFENCISQIPQFKITVQGTSKKKKSECEEMIKCLFTRINFDAIEIEKQVLAHYSKIDKSIKDFMEYLSGQYNKLIKEIENILVVYKVGNPLSFEKISKDFTSDNKEQIKTIIEDDPHSTSRNVVKVLSIVPIISFFTTNYYLPTVESNKKENEEKNTKLNNLIHKMDKEKLTALNMNISNIENYFANAAAQLLHQVNDEIQLRNKYKSYLTNLFN